MLMADTVMDADEPRFQIGEDEMDDRQIVLGNLWVAATRQRAGVFIPALAEAGISHSNRASDGQRPSEQRRSSTNPQSESALRSGSYGEPDTPGIASVLSLVLRGSPVSDDEPRRHKRREPCEWTPRPSPRVRPINPLVGSSISTCSCAGPCR